MAITKVALAGASGNLGPEILNQLVLAGFEVTVLTRQGSTHAFPAGVTVTTVDYDSVDALTEALRGQHAVVSTLGAPAFTKQINLVEAAAKAGVQRFLPSEFGSNTVHPKTSQLPCFRDKVLTQEALKKKAATSSLTYTFLITGPFFDWGMKVGFVQGLKSKTATLFDGGHRRFSTSTLATIGKAVAGVLKHPKETENRAVYVNDTAITLKELLEKSKKVVGPDGWKEDVVSIDDRVAQGYAELKKPEPNPANFVFNFLQASIWGEGYGSHFDKLDNELLGLKVLTDAEVDKVIETVAKS